VAISSAVPGLILVAWTTNFALQCRHLALL